MLQGGLPKFAKVSSIVLFYSKFSKALTFENFSVGVPQCIGLAKIRKVSSKSFSVVLLHSHSLPPN